MSEDAKRWIDEIAALHEADRLEREHRQFVDRDECYFNHQPIGLLSELPPHIQAYIKDLREQIWELAHIPPR